MRHTGHGRRRFLRPSSHPLCQVLTRPTSRGQPPVAVDVRLAPVIVTVADEQSRWFACRKSRWYRGEKETMAAPASIIPFVFILPIRYASPHTRSYRKLRPIFPSRESIPAVSLRLTIAT